MDANSRKILGLIAEMNVRFRVPVYQRPYSWGTEQCAQLWDDILSCGRSRDRMHFTGSIVTIQDGQLSDQGVAELLVIDGQQRITTISLLLAALVRYARNHPTERLSFSADEIMLSGYLTNGFRSGDDHYKLTLSKHDRASWQAIIDSLDNQVAWEPRDAPPRLRENLSFFERRLEALTDVDAVWRGLKRLEVVGISLTQGQDDPQVIFESMNSTGKDLSVADLVRNFVLMSYPLSEQPALFATYWQPIEGILGATGDFDESFEDFLRSYLSIVHAPRPMDKIDVYQAFKRYVQFMGFNEGDRMKNLTLRLKRFSTYYAAVVKGTSQDEDLARSLSRIRTLSVRAINPLLMSLLDAYDHHDLTRDELLELLKILESYLLRRSVADLAPSAMYPFLASLVAKVEAVRNEEGTVAPALTHMLLNEDATVRRFPTDAEFAHALASRDVCNFQHVVFLLQSLEEQLSKAMPNTTTVEHIMPVRALTDDGWLKVLGEHPDYTFESCVNALGNLTLTSNAFDAPEATFADKQKSAEKDGLALSEDIVAAADWTPERIEGRTKRLVELAGKIWTRPEVDQEAGSAYRQSERAAATRQISFKDLFEAKLVEMDDALVSVSPLHPGRATVTSTGKIMLQNGEMFEDPTAAYGRFLETLGWEDTGQDGWMYWRRGDGGPLLDDLRSELA